MAAPKKFPVILMLVGTMFSVIVNIFSKLATINDMSTSVLSAYRFIFGAMLLAPWAIYNSWGNSHNLTWKRIFFIFMCGLFGGPLYQNLYLESLRFMPVTFATAIINLTPVVAFILEKILRKESLKLRTSAGILKIIGIILGTVGVALLTLCHHLEINIGSIKFDLLSQVKHETEENYNLVLGLGLAVMATLCNAIFLIVLKKIKDDGEKKKIEDDGENILLIPSLINVMGAIQATIYALCVEKDWAQWKLGWDIRLLAVLFVGLIGSGLNTTIITFCVSKMGPVFVYAFSPMGLILMVVFGSLLLNEKFYLTSLIATVIIIIATTMLICEKLREMPDTDTDAYADVDVELREMSTNTDADVDVELGEMPTNADADANADAYADVDVELREMPANPKADANANANTDTDADAEQLGLEVV